MGRGQFLVSRWLFTLALIADAHHAYGV